MAAGTGWRCRKVQASFNETANSFFEPPMVMLWNASELELIAPLKDHTDRVNSATFSFDSTKLLTTSNDGSVRLWDVASGTLLSTISGHGGIVTTAIFSPDSARIVTVSNDRTARLWDLGGKLVKVLEGHTGEVRHVAVSPDGSLVATGSDDFSVRVWHAHQGTLFKNSEWSRGWYSIGVFSDQQPHHLDFDRRHRAFMGPPERAGVGVER